MPVEFSYFANILQQSNFPHSQSNRGTLDPNRLCILPRIAPRALAQKELRAKDHVVLDQARKRLDERRPKPLPREAMLEGLRDLWVEKGRYRETS
ncbi:hypothetical protein [Mesorhizobium sp. M1406]|uniref:hypothetical protein n=1 Tax=Mesorhizobium sp. M1406 TaxID=2957099 RepID=UPI0033390D55